MNFLEEYLLDLDMVLGEEDIRAKGRYEYPRDIIANLLVQNQNAIIRAERNKVGQSFLKLIEDNPDLTREMARVVQKRPLVRVISNGTLKLNQTLTSVIEKMF